MRTWITAAFAAISIWSGSGFCSEWAAGAPALPLGPWFYAETDLEPGKLVQAETGAGFQPYNGGYLSRDESRERRMYTFRADLVLDESAGERTVAIFMGPGDYPRDLYLNGVLLLKTGDHGERYNATVYYSSRVILPPQLLKYGGETNRIAVEAFPAYETSPLGDVAVGDYLDITRMVFSRNFFNTYLVMASVVVAAIIALFFSFLFIRSPAKDRRYLYCTLLCLSFALAYSNMTFFHDAANDVTLDKLSRMGLVLTSLFIIYFAMAFTGVWDRRRWPKAVLALPALVSIAGNLAQPDKRGLQTFFSSFTTNFILTPYLLVILGILIAGLIKRRDSSRLAVFAGFLVAIGASLHDLYYISIRTAPFCYLVAYGYLAFLVSIFFVLALEQSRLLTDLATQTGRLEHRTRLLGDMVADIRGVAEGLVVSSAELGGTIGATLTAIGRYGEDTRAIADSVRNHAQGIEAEIGRIAESTAASAERVPRALEAQTKAVESVNGTLAAMNSRIEESLGSAAESSRAAGTLAEEAEESARVIGKSKATMAEVAVHSESLQAVLATIEDIAERTHILSINAAIESARFGAEGRGFGVVAQEIRKLADQSRGSLGQSFERIKEMSESASKGSELSNHASGMLEGMVDQARLSAKRTEDILRLIEQQKAQGDAIYRSAEELLGEARLLKELSSGERRENLEREARFRAMRESLGSLSKRLDGRDEMERELREALDAMREVMASNAEHIERLRRSIEKAQA